MKQERKPVGSNESWGSKSDAQKENELYQSEPSPLPETDDNDPLMTKALDKYSTPHGKPNPETHAYLQGLKDAPPPADWKEVMERLLNSLAYFIEVDGSLCEGFRTKEILLEIKKLASSPTPPPAETVDAKRIAEVLEECEGYWSTCSGCHESEDGHDVGFYLYSQSFNCKKGGGCRECGGVGVVWNY